MAKEVVTVPNEKTTVADVQQMIAAEKEAIECLRRARGEALDAEKEAFAELKEQREAWLKAERSECEALEARRQELAAQIEELAAQLAVLKGEPAPAAAPAAVEAAPAPARRGRPKGKRRVGRPRGKRGGLTLREAIAQILAASDMPLRAKQIAGRLQDQGYTTTSKNPINMVSALLGQTKAFRRVRKGLYTLDRRAKV